MKKTIFLLLLLSYGINANAQLYAPEIKVQNTTTGGFGINTSNPQFDFDVYGDGRFINLHLRGSGDINENMGISFNYNRALVKYEGSPASGSPRLLVLGGGGKDLVLGADSQEIMFFDKDNLNVGIGINNPSQKLHVQGNAVISNPSNGRSFLISPASGMIESNGSGFNINRFSTNNVVLALGGGDVGIGKTPESNYKLDVAGKIHGTSFHSSTQTIQWPDFVFADQHRLMPLYEVESFIKNNKHLPEIPSEEEVKEHGIDLASMDAKLLQKIEELTLYLIEQNKEITSLRSELEQIKQNQK